MGIGCSDDPDPVEKDSGPAAVEAGTPDMKQITSDLKQVQQDTAQSDTTPVVYNAQVTLGYDDGVPAIKLVADPSTKGHLVIDPAADLLPVEVRQVKILPATAYTATLEISPAQGNAQGTPVYSKEVTFAATDVDTWTTIDLSAEKIQMNGPFWITFKYPATFEALTQTVYGGISSSGQSKYYKAGYPIWDTNFDQLVRVVVGTPKTEEMLPVGDGEPCTWAGECQSGFCLAGLCAASCKTEGCSGEGMECRDFELGEKVCVKTCTQLSDCPAQGICLTEAAEGISTGFCTQAGPTARDADCQYHWHTYCSTGYCSACATDPGCNAVGTCTDKP